MLKQFSKESSDPELIERYQSAGKKKIGVSGSSGLIGSAFVEFAASAGHEVVRLVRQNPTPSHSDIYWNPQAQTIDREKLREIDVLVHLAGENIASGRWNAERKAQIRQSRVEGTKFLVTEYIEAAKAGAVLVSASAIGIYGDHAENWCDEDTSPGAGFLPELCRDWESAAIPSIAAGIRLAIPRIGIVLSPQGGALQKMLPAFRLGLGGRLGSGQQYMSWIALQDMVRLLYNLALDPSASGVFNAVAPVPVTNSEFAQALAHALHRPCLTKIPAPILRLLLGEFADQALLVSSRVGSKRLPNLGFSFKYPELPKALQHIL